jgi:cyclic pyranopterin phosphate synthase
MSGWKAMTCSLIRIARLENLTCSLKEVMDQLSHFDSHGASRMVDVGNKDVTVRIARASGRVRMRPDTLRLIRQRELSKGDVLEVARLAAIMAAKRTAELIPLCHVLPLDVVSVRFEFPDAGSVAIETEARATARTGVEMEALVAVCTAALTIYDMCKSVDRAMVIEEVQLEEKSGGESGHFVRET